MRTITDPAKSKELRDCCIDEILKVRDCAPASSEGYSITDIITAFVLDPNTESLSLNAYDRGWCVSYDNPKGRIISRSVQLVDALADTFIDYSRKNPGWSMAKASRYIDLSE